MSTASNGSTGFFRRWMALATCTAAVTFVATASCAAPVIRSITGSSHDVGAITITGSGFGASGPRLVLYDDFDKGSLGAPIPLLSPAVGGWAASGSIAPTYDNGQRAGQGMRTFTSGAGTQQLKVRFPRTSEVLVSYWVKLQNGYFPNTATPNTFPASSSWKLAWIMNGDDGYRGQDDLCLPSFIDGHNFALSGNSTGTVLYTGNSDTNRWFSFSDWMRITVYLKGGTPDPALDPGTTWFQAINGTAQKVFTSGSKPVMGGNFNGNPRGWTQINFPGWLAGGASQSTRPVYDDIYVATGPGARARVEIGNASSYTASTRLAMVTVTDWSDTSIKAQVSKDSFPSGGAFLYIVDANGVVNSTGFPVVVGGGGIAPAPPQILNATKK